MSDEVSQFLEQVERLRGQQIEDDEMRAREREEFLAAKRERQARREGECLVLFVLILAILHDIGSVVPVARWLPDERARSISPQKSSPANTPSPRTIRRTVNLSESLRLDSPAGESLDKLRERSTETEKPLEADAQPDAMLYSTSQTKENEAPEDLDAKRGDDATASQRASQLSWQRRTTRSNSRPLSVVAARNAAATYDSAVEEPPSPTQPLSKDQIAKSLGSKDASWFRQTADRGADSAAYRRNQVEDDDRLDMSSLSAQLPGMTSESSGERPASRGENVLGKLASPFSLNPPSFDNPATERPKAEPIAPTATGRTSPVRTTSPTKGMGGFVQSAMMKRSDSVKRWSVASPPALTRPDNMTTHRGSIDRGAAPSRPQSMFVRTSRPTSRPSSRPTSRHGEKDAKSFETSPRERRPKTPTSMSPPQPQRHELLDDAALPVSPTKTMEPRRWSPTKSSWLESALNKPDSPKVPPKPASSQQPAWMVELNRNKAGRGGNPTPEPSRPAAPSHKHQVSIDGLMRSTPMGSRLNLNTTGLGGIYSPPGTQSVTTRSSVQNFSVSTPMTDGPERPRSKSRGALDQVRERRSESISSPINPPPAKVKPEAPPKKDLDFRGNLKPRAAEAPVPKTQEPEFKAVFGTLRRTKTQNFKAPDELKDNILRGKAALNATDGPQKSIIRDEFKDAIQKKRDDFKKAQAEGTGIASTVPRDKSKPILPEGLAMRAELGKSTAVLQQDAPLENRTPSENAEPDTPTRTEESLPNLLKKKSAPSKLGGLAGRFNPALAGMLARGPPPAAASNGGSRGEESGRGDGDIQPAQPGPQLTHMTKSRARGPRRKAPTNVGNPSGNSTNGPADSSSVSRQPAAFGMQSFPAPVEDRKPVSHPIQDRAAARPDVPIKPKPIEGRKPEADSRPVEPVAPLNLRRRQTESAIQVGQLLSSRPETPQKPEVEAPKKLNLKRMSKFFELPKDNATTATSETPKTPGKLSPQKTGTWEPVKTGDAAKEAAKLIQQKTGPWSPVKKTVNAAPERASAAVKAPLPGPKPASFNGLPKAVDTRPASPPPAAAALSHRLPQAQAEPALASPSRPQTSHGNDVSAILHDFFGPPYESVACDMDYADILTNYPKIGAKGKTLSFHMFQIDGDGKQMIVPAYRERILFEQEMYIAGHNFTNEAGWKVREVYFWIGDEVADADEDAAEAVAQQEAKQLGGKLIKIRQGKETPELLQALGGIVIVRRGASTRYDSLAPSMLCGRRYQGQVAFDEVDFTTASLCAGFAYLITHSGNCYLWKGKGSDVDELSGARLIGMDLTVTGQLIEYDEGSEPASFWDMMGGESKPHSADHWRLKPSFGKYNSRLFCADVESRQKIFEISPFNQADMSTFNIYILDAFFEMYIIVGSQAQSQYASFRTALDFAQEYAVLAASMEDRPFIPISTVVLEGVPRDLKRVFRKWTDERCPTLLHNPSTEAGLKRGRSLRVVPLTQAILALRE
ncbi:uncharacterized protein TRIVIDRAFT_39161 [Trichoderma virens Gv29-8]|uniref:DUF4045 domain-containing protein n=1 Tax=Hypocrea virens (strain Gv29-8 / FGSC 10586) TaxID=413071 RepID=G9ND63_HYPVG|nr:uncharacterized protein TRIVIDRAFT_39161 [Trichoderma virens Gv29-8]EHK15632.1 hypothetical protein TRIVIDRAFT_39161 [Trichoderma virens Gv29-8]